MEKRLFLAIALSLLVLISWSTLVTKTYHIDNKGVTKEQAAPKIIASEQSRPLPSASEIPPSLLTFSQDKFNINFVESQAAIKEVIFKEYQNYRFPLQYGLLLQPTSFVFKKESFTPNSAIFVHNDGNTQIIKRFIFYNSSYNIDLEIIIENLSKIPTVINLPLVLGVLSFDKDPVQARYKDVTVVTAEKTLHLNGRSDSAFDKVRFLAMRDRYFCGLIEPVANNLNGFIKKIGSKDAEIGLTVPEFILSEREKKELKFRIYLGPQDLKIINRINPDWAAVMYYGTFNFISHLLLQLLEILFRFLRNWGWVIIVLSLIIYLLLYPLSLKQMAAMKEMQALQPKIEELRKTYKDNPQKLNKEIMELYRQHRVNPFGGCLPLILQIPIFFALYQVLVRSIALKGASFLWIKDLSEPDRLFVLPNSLPIIGNEINILPIIMTIGMFIQQRISLATASGSSAEQQRLMMVLFPLMFGFIFYKMPSGLVLYWFINSGLMLWQQFRISRKK